jgi:hypothetical protein
VSKLRWLVLASALFGAALFASRPLPIAKLSSNSPATTTNHTLKPGATNGCSCHGAVDANTNATITGPSQLYAGDYGIYQITGSKTGVAAATNFGFNAAASDATTVISLQPGEPTNTFDVGANVNNREVTHIPTLRQINTATNYYKFRYTMPGNAANNSTHTLYGVISVASLGGWNNAPNFTVTTKPLPTLPGTAAAGTPGSASIPLNWTGGGPSYRVLYKTGSFPANSGDGSIGYDGSGTSTTIGNLTPSTQYFFSVFSEDAGVSSGALFFSTTGRQVTATTAAAQATNWYVNVGTGDDTNSGTAANTPFKTIGHANQVALSGDTINVAAGTYSYAPPPC